MARIGLVAHDDKKDDLCVWAEHHKLKLSQHELWGTGTTGSRVMAATGMVVTLLKSGPLGGDQQLGAMIAEGKLDVLIFFIDPLSAQPHDVDVKALTRLATLYDVPCANNKSTADAVLAYL
ncbi:methylglyoxal synthase [Devosia ginsengisoli]|uniref:Methylglyoxal synthase n=2 Tax=Devosia ginsengisoli TaxID=400770 RepID=A0A5B8LUG0_9HYPH|nr:methylglyoxal synthase [Devosia ginsengisoli]QDZ11803.1 methylglyoxal synthase [Devosia ginsengisoli]